MFFSASTGGFYIVDIHGDNMPADVVEITAEQHADLLEGQSKGMMIIAGADGHPVLVDPPAPAPLTVEQIEALRLAAYADPVAGSDRFFAEVARMQVMGEDGWESARQKGADRYQEIKAEYPWP